VGSGRRRWPEADRGHALLEPRPLLTYVVDERPIEVQGASLVEHVVRLPRHIVQAADGFLEIVAGDERVDHEVGIVLEGMVAKGFVRLGRIEPAHPEGEDLDTMPAPVEVHLETLPERVLEIDLQRFDVGISDDRDTEKAGGLFEGMRHITPSLCVDAVAGEPFSRVAPRVTRPVLNSDGFDVSSRNEVGREMTRKGAEKALGSEDSQDQRGGDEDGPRPDPGPLDHRGLRTGCR
jgi:hypothetical protein